MDILFIITFVILIAVLSWKFKKFRNFILDFWYLIAAFLSIYVFAKFKGKSNNRKIEELENKIEEIDGEIVEVDEEIKEVDKNIEDLHEQKQKLLFDEEEIDQELKDSLKNIDEVYSKKFEELNKKYGKD